MGKKVLFLLCLMAVPVYGKQDPVKINLSAPASVVAGSDFEVTISIYKSSLKDYSRFSQDIPSGFSAENIDSPNADFTFNDQRVRIIWLKLPAEKEITIKYLISVHERLSGTLELNGTFAYVDKGEREYVEIKEPVKVEILPNPEIDPSLVVDISEFSTIKMPTNIVYPVDSVSKEGDFASVIRQKPYIDEGGSVYISVLIKKPEGTNFLKLEESIPGGYAFESISAGDAVVSQASSIARFIWMKAPSASTLVIKYRLVPIFEKDQEAVNVKGTLTYSEDGNTKTAAVKEMDVNIDAMNIEQQNGLLVSGTIPAGLPEIKPPQINTTTKVLETKSNVTVQAGVQTVKTSPVKQYKKNRGLTLPVIETLDQSPGLYYRVQVAAVRHPYFDRVVFAEYDLFRDVKVEQIEGWSKYTVGSLSQYEAAVRLKERIIAETPEDSAFVVAYIDGRRIPLTLAMNAENSASTAGYQANVSQKIAGTELNNSEKELLETSSDLSLSKVEPLEISEGVYFRVQVAALRNPSYDRKYFSDRALLKDAKVEYIDGWRKLTIGSLMEYEEAVQLRNRINSEIPKSSAFIVAYKNEKRVPVAEVLVP